MGKSGSYLRCSRDKDYRSNYSGIFEPWHDRCSGEDGPQAIEQFESLLLAGRDVTFEAAEDVCTFGCAETSADLCGNIR